MSAKPSKKNQETESLQEQIIKLEKQLESFKHSTDHFLKNKLFLHYDVKEPEKVVVDCETKLPVLAEVGKKKIQKGEESDPTHLLIEGDNYHALSVLNYTHVGKIDLIYIDPPYNTGNKDFIYNDRFVDREDSFRHSAWLSFMAHRLRLAKNLLAETGVIFISIDDNEQAHLRLLCDQIFGEENFLSMLVVESGEVFGTKAAHADKTFVKVKDYVLVYTKNNGALKNKQPLYDATRELYDSHFSTIIDEDLSKKTVENLLTQEKWVKELFDQYKIKINKKNINTVMSLNEKFREFMYLTVADKLYADQPFTKKLDPVFVQKQEPGKPFKFEDKILFKTSAGTIRMFVRFKESIKKSDDYNSIYTRCTLRGDLWKGFHTDMRNIQDEGEVDFKNGKKPIRLMKQLIKWFNKKDAIVLDFFAGSGTTGHAVLKLNAEEKAEAVKNKKNPDEVGNRQFILCSTNDEKEPIVDKVLYPRIKKVIDGYGDNAPIPANLRYFQTDFVEKKGNASQLKLDLTRKCAEMLCVKENVFEAVKLKKSAKNYKFFKNGDKYLGVFFDFFTDEEFAGFIKELNALPKEAEKAVYIFVLDGSAGIFADVFAGVANCEVKEIPQKILDIYKQLAREVARK